MQFLVAFVAVVAVASANSLHRPLVQSALELDAIVAAINSPSVDPATAALLEQQLEAILNPAPIVATPAIVPPAAGILPIAPVDIDFAPIAVGPVVVDQFQPISVGPAIVDFPLPDGGAVTEIAPAPVAVAPAVVPEASAASSPLVQIIVNIQSNSDATPVTVESPVVAAPAVNPVQVVEFAPEAPSVVEAPVVGPSPVSVVDSAPQAPISVVEVAPTPVQVVDFVPETVAVAAPIIIGAPAVSLPETLN